MPAILFGSISTIADTSELQREAFNRAFAAHGLDWQWDRPQYTRLLQSSGGRGRINDYAVTTGETVDADAIHQTKSELFQTSLSESDLAPRPGVADTIRQAKEHGVKLALVTTTSPENVAALMSALHGELATSDFDLIVDASAVDQPKPDKAAYVYALHSLNESADDVIAIEDNLGGVQSAVAAGLQCAAFPNQNTADHDFATSHRLSGGLSFHEVRTLIPSA